MGAFSRSFDIAFEITMHGWPTINDMAEYTRQPPTDEVLHWSLDAAIAYGQIVLDDWLPNSAVFQACLDYAGTLYTLRIGQADYYGSPIEGSTPQQRYRRVLLASRPVAFA